MDYGRILSRAWEITWRWKVLWILGFLAALSGGSGGSSNFRTSYQGRDDMPEWLRELGAWDLSPRTISLLVGFGALVLFISLILWVVAIIARGGLVAGVQQVEEEGNTSFGRAWRVGLEHFWSLLGVAVLTILPFVLLGLILLGIFFLVAISTGFLSQGNMPRVSMGLLCCGAPFFVCGGFLLVIVLGQIRIYAENAIVLEGLGWLDAFQRAWRVLVENLGSTLVLWLIFLAIGIAFAVVIGGVAAAFLLPIVALSRGSDSGSWTLFPIIVGGVFTTILGALIGSVVQTFTSATWTLAYREFVGLAAHPEPEVVGE